MSAIADGVEETAEQEIEEEKRTLCVLVCKVHLIHSSLLVQLVGSILIPILSFSNLSALMKTKINFSFL